MGRRSGWIDVFATGHVSIRGENDDGSRTTGTLPCYDAGSLKWARDLVTFACVEERDGTGLKVPGFEVDNLASIDAAKARFAKCHEHMKAGRAKRKALGYGKAART